MLQKTFYNRGRHPERGLPSRGLCCDMGDRPMQDAWCVVHVSRNENHALREPRPQPSFANRQSTPEFRHGVQDHQHFASCGLGYALLDCRKLRAPSANAAFAMDQSLHALGSRSTR
jgi:hypothetical protein